MTRKVPVAHRRHSTTNTETSALQREPNYVSLDFHLIEDVKPFVHHSLIISLPTRLIRSRGSDKAERARECVRALNQGTIRTLGHRKRSWVILPHEIFSIDTTTPSLLNLIRWRYDDILGYLVESLSSGLTGNPRSSHRRPHPQENRDLTYALTLRLDTR